MKDDIQATVALDPGQESAARRLFERIGRGDLVRPSYPVPYSFALASEAEIEALVQAWKALGLGTPEPFVRWDRAYSEAELLAAPLLHLVVTRPEKGSGGPKYGTEYDLSAACSTCGSGARQTSRLAVKPGELAKDGSIAQTLTREILVSEELARRLEGAGVSGVELRPVESIQPGRSSPWIQLLASTTMPPFSPETEGIVRERPCEVCGRDGHFQTAKRPERIRYRAADVDVDALPDIVRTWELFGNSVLRQPLSASHFAYPLILVKPRVYRLLNDVKGTAFVPVDLVG